MSKDWIAIVAVWVLVGLGALVAVLTFEPGYGIRSLGVLAAASLALVSVVNLFTSHSQGIVRRQIYTAGGAYAILGVAGLYLLLK